MAVSLRRPLATGPEIIVRRAEERGHARQGWLDSYHTFSFGGYLDPSFMGFRCLRVINEDRVKAGAGFPPHGHRDMEILSYVLEGELSHRDSMGNGSIIRPGEFQRMSAGRGITHSESNSGRGPLHFLQIWIEPEKTGIEPGYEQRRFLDEERDGQLRLVASRDGRQGSLLIHQDVNLYSAILRPGETIEDRLAPERYCWVQVVRGVVSLNDEVLSPGDGACLSGGGAIELYAAVGGPAAEVLLFDLA